LRDLERFSEIGQRPHGTTRLAYTDEWKEAQMMAKGLLEEAGMETAMDAVGNLIGRMEGKNPELPLVAMGSHLDTVPTGGNFDGVLGVAAAIEVARAISEDGVETRRGLQVMSFACEEGSRFGVGCIGSKTFVGELSPKSAERIRDVNGLTLSQCLKTAGYEPTFTSSIMKRELASYLELHIEQGPVLERLGKQVGVVTGIAAPTRLLIHVEGQTGHVGTVPMKERKDALVAAAEIIRGVEEIVVRAGDGVATVGRIEVQPNNVTAIPGSVRLWVDLRFLDGQSKDRCSVAINELANKIGSQRKLKIESEVLTREESVKLSSQVIDVIKQTANSIGYSSHEMASGAMHDAAHMARIANVGMIFIPCKGGISHAPEEYASPKDMEAGLNVLYGTCIKLANQ
jgi:N-carbamoyl-L-amino-acid hydrolase